MKEWKAVKVQNIGLKPKLHDLALSRVKMKL
jgi:hypothetical protein